MAQECAKSVIPEMQHPLRNVCHVTRSESADLDIIVDQSDLAPLCFTAREELPEPMKPRHAMGKPRVYSYHLTVTCEILPLFNLSGMPVLGAVPILCGPAKIAFHSEVPVEYRPSLNG